MGKPDPRREMFLRAFVNLFWRPSDTMAVKCWREVSKRLTPFELQELNIHLTRAADKASASRRKEREKSDVAT